MEVMKHNTPSRVKHIEKEKTRILLPVSGTDLIYALPGIEGGSSYRRMLFHLLVLEDDNVYFDWSPSLLNCALLRSVVAVDNSIYIYGRGPYISGFESELELDRLKSLHPDKIFHGFSRFDWSTDKSGQTNVWCAAPIQTRKRFPLCVSLDGKIYIFGPNYFEPEVFDPAVGQSKALDLPCELVGCEMSCNPLSDPSNRRILVHLFDGQLPSPSIYEFRPDDDSSGGKWKPIAVDFNEWTSHAAVVDNVICFYCSNDRYLIRAFDLATGAWLRIRWESKFKKVHGLHPEVTFDAMLSLGNRILCFIVWVPMLDKASPGWVKVHIFKFRVERSGATVNLYPIRSYSYELPNTERVLKFLPF